MGQGQSGEALNRNSSAPAGAPRQLVRALFVLTGGFVAVKTAAHDSRAVTLGLAALALILLLPQPPHEREPWRAHALRVVSACLVVVTLATLVSALSRH